MEFIDCKKNNLPTLDMTQTSSITNDTFVSHTLQEHCSICCRPLIETIDLPGLPLTETYCRESVTDKLPNIDQKFLFCSVCGHGQLRTQIAPNILYGSNYCFRTSASATARQGTQFFLSVLDEVAPVRQFQCVLDLGCNDLFLLNLLKDRAQFRVGIDPVWQGRESERVDKSIQVIGRNFEDVDLSELPAKPDLIVCRHTLEHIFDPCSVVKLLIDNAAEDALFIFEVPGFDGLIQRFRFDHIFHQHAQYFSLASFLKLLEKVGGRHLLHRFNLHDWGAMAVAFVRGTANVPVPARIWKPTEIIGRYRLFQKQMQTAGILLDFCTDSPLYGYGAAQMLPVLGYHMNTDFSQLIGVLDDDASKDGIGYWNLPVKVMLTSKVVNLHEATVLITAIDNIQPIMKKLMISRPQHVIHPLNII
jgi:hypothetical protein